MNGNDLMLSINCALLDEQRKAYDNRTIFDRDEITIMATAKAIYKMVNMFEPYGNFYQEGVTKCFGCNLKMIDGTDAEVYLARKIPIFTEKLSEEGAEE